ncbi:ThiF family adenylyltransferase [Leifsonia sp. NPDC077715]|uniref:ThiF family adenylyltransferase n=1 Tax=Leifsonia sp. NPDC077715 TaxID=3155539 RepID=UPI00341FEF0C
MFDEDRAFAIGAGAGLLDTVAGFLTEPSPRVPSEAEAVMRELMGRGAVTYSTEMVDRNGQFSRQLEYWAAFSDVPDEVQSRLESSSVLVLGLGGTGSEFLRLMVAAGVRRYGLLDRDVVELSNLNRQTLYRLRDVGKLKVDACSEYIADRLSDHRCVTSRRALATADDVADIVAATDPDLTLIAVDEPPAIMPELATTLSGWDRPFLVAGVGVKHGRSYPVSAITARDALILGTAASIGTTNAITAAYAAHAALEHLSKTPLPFRIHHEP